LFAILYHAKTLCFHYKIWEVSIKGGNKRNPKARNSMLFFKARTKVDIYRSSGYEKAPKNFEEF